MSAVPNFRAPGSHSPELPAADARATGAVGPHAEALGAPSDQAAVRPRFARTLVAGTALLTLLAVLAALVHTGPVDRLDLHVDRAAQPLRSAWSTDVFRWLTDASAEVVGVAALVVGLAVLVARGRWLTGARLLLTAGAAWSLALVLKAAVDRPRPPASLWLQPPDNSGSFPSGHDTTATLLIVIVVAALTGTGRVRRVCVALAVVFALAVGFGRVYLGDHYPTDILGSYLTVAATALLVLAVTGLAPVRRWLARVGIADGRTPMSWRGRSSDAACPCPAAQATPSTESVPASVRPHGHPHGLALSTGHADIPHGPSAPAHEKVRHPLRLSRLAVRRDSRSTPSTRGSTTGAPAPDHRSKP